MTKKHLLNLLFLILVTNTFGQERKFCLDLGLQWHLPERYFNSELPMYNQSNAGAGFHIQPKWYYKKNTTVGINIEYAMVQENATTDNIDMLSVFSFAPTVTHYFTNRKIRPYLGLGLGAYCTNNKNLYIGIRPAIGVSFFKRFNISFEYNKIFKQPSPLFQLSRKYDDHYITLKGSYSIGLW